MRQPNRLLSVLAVIIVSLAMLGCGMAPATNSRIAAESVVDTSAMDFSPQEAARAAELNRSGLLETKDIAEFEDALGVKAERISDRGVQLFGLGPGKGVAKVKRATRIGYVRSIEEGSYKLVLRGEQSVALEGKDGKRDARIAKFLNRKVIVRGIVDEQGMIVEHMLPIPSFKFVTDLFFKGRLAGSVFLKSTRQPMRGALVVLTQEGTGYLFRTQSNARGSFGFSGLEPGEYKVEVRLGGFKPVTYESISVQKGKKTALHAGVVPNGN